MAEEQLEPEIDTKGKPVTLPPGGRIVFKCLEVKEIKGSHTIVYYVKLDNEKAKIHESPPTKNNIFVGELQTVDIPVDKEKVIFEFDTKGLLSNSFMGEVRIDMTDLYNGYPHDHWYPLKGKGGKVDKKVTGKAHIQIMYLQPGAKPKHDEFSYALHSIINSGRVDLFEMKISDLGGQVSYPDDKGNTPLVHAAIHGAAPFIKLLIEHQASISEEKDSDGRNAIHLAALKGHTLALRYLVSRKGIDIDAPDNTKLRSTALHLAADQNHGDCVTILVKAGANINAQDDKGDTPLHFALQQKSGAVKSVTTLVDLGANIYARNNNSLAVWEVAHKKDLCYSSTTRHAFMKACGVIDQREFQIGETYPQTQRFLGSGLGPDWTKTTQFSLKSKKDISEVVVLAYSLERTDDCMQQVGFCVVKDVDSEHTLPSFQPEGIGFGSFESFKFNLEKEFTYTVITYTTKESDLTGEFGVTVFTPHGSIQPTVREAKPWKNTVSVEGEWKGKTAAGTTPEDNPQFRLTCESKKETEVMVMLQQNTSDVSSIVFDDNRIVPAKYYIGLYVYSSNMKTEITKSARWHNSKDVYLRLTMGGEEASELVIIPTTRKEGEELPFTISAYSDAKIGLSGGKKKK